MAAAVRAPTPEVLAAGAVEHDDAAIAVAIGDEHLVIGGIHQIPDGRPINVVSLLPPVSLYLPITMTTWPVRENLTVRLLSRALVQTKPL